MLNDITYKPISRVVLGREVERSNIIDLDLYKSGTVSQTQNILFMMILWPDFSMSLYLIITVAHTCSALLIAFDNINTVYEIGLYDIVALTASFIYAWTITHNSLAYCECLRIPLFCNLIQLQLVSEIVPMWIVQMFVFTINHSI